MKASESRLSLDFQPRLLVQCWPETETNTSEGSPLDAIFVPVRDRPGYTLDLLRCLLDAKAPIFLLPTRPTDLAGVSITQFEHVRAVTMDDPSFRLAFGSLRTTFSSSFSQDSADWDLPAKRNYALWYARRHAFKNILLLDDDIRGLQNTHLSAGSSALKQYSVAGFFPDDFADRSVIGHARTKAGQDIQTFLSGSCLFIRVDSCVTFFPQIYNEDWLFLLPYILSQAACSLGPINQVEYDPFSNPRIAVFQEFGEIIADGLFAMMVAGLYEERLDLQIWREILTLRSKMLEKLVRVSFQQQCRNAVEAAFARCRAIREEDCVRFVREWETDMGSWSKALSLKGCSD